MSRNPDTSERAKALGDFIVVSSRIRLARNFSGEMFPVAAPESALQSVFERSVGALERLRKFKDGKLVKMSEAAGSYKSYLVETRLITRDLAEGGENTGVMIAPEGFCSVMINEEDHLRIQMIAPGQKLGALWKSVNTLDLQLEKSLDFAFSEKYGYITSCPSNLGTGMRASLMMHFPALVFSGHMERVTRGINQIGMVARGENGEGSEAIGNFFQISNQQTLGMTEEEIISKIIRVCKRLQAFELNARQILLQTRGAFLADKIARAWALLTSCRMIGSAEAIGCISTLRLAADMGFMNGERAELVGALDMLSVRVKPAHMEELVGLPNSDSDARDIMRSSYIKSVLEKFEAPDLTSIK